METGKVWLVGAGPGDAGLLTIKGKQILDTADVIVYDALVGEAIVSTLPETAELVYVGKRDNHHTMDQETINQLLVGYAKEGKRVVRLKGGDPFLFGRGGEEVEALRKENLSFEVVPGVSSSLAVPAYSGIPVTHRNLSSSVHIITGHRSRNEELKIDFDALLRIGGTYVFLMGVRTFPEICEGFLKAGMHPDTPAALLMQGTTAGQKKIVATVSTLQREVEARGAIRPAILVIGEVCQLAENFSWYEELPLYGVKVVVTRPRNRSQELTQSLRNLGAEVLSFPTICTQPVADQSEWEAELEHIDSYDWLVFTSPAGVDIFFEKLQARKMDVRALGNIKLAVIGEGTKQQLSFHGLLADLMPEEYNGRALGLALAETVKDGERVLVARARNGNPDVVKLIEERRQVTVTDLAIYDTFYENPKNFTSNRFKQELQNQEIEKKDNLIVLFTSASTVRGFAACMGEMDLSCVQAVCIGHQTKAVAESYKMQCLTAKEATIEGLIQAVLEWRTH